MKIAFFTGTIALGLVWTSMAQAAPTPGRKLPGPSAVEAARLKKNPPPNYLAHYLPDDRYKIAGGVWKYVSTDLDTFYHVPTSPNMLRQPASRVIGFANARDAEEAGYVADPTDGTASKVAQPVSVTGGTSSVSANRGNLSSSEKRYLDYVTTIFDQLQANSDAAHSEGDKIFDQIQNQGLDKSSGLVLFRPLASKLISQQLPLLAKFNRIVPPKRMRRYHDLTRSAMKSLIDSEVLLFSGMASGNQLEKSRSDVASKMLGMFIYKSNEDLDKLK